MAEEQRILPDRRSIDREEEDRRTEDIYWNMREEKKSHLRLIGLIIFLIAITIYFLY